MSAIHLSFPLSVNNVLYDKCCGDVPLCPQVSVEVQTSHSENEMKQSPQRYLFLVRAQNPGDPIDIWQRNPRRSGNSAPMYDE